MKESGEARRTPRRPKSEFAEKPEHDRKRRGCMRSSARTRSICGRKPGTGSRHMPSMASQWSVLPGGQQVRHATLGFQHDANRRWQHVADCAR